MVKRKTTTKVVNQITNQITNQIIKQMGQEEEINGNVSDDVNGNVADDSKFNRKRQRRSDGKPPVRKDYKSSKKKESLEDIIKKRNKRLVEFFRLCGIPVSIIGNENTPAMVYDYKYILNAYVHNFELRFTDHHNQGNVIYTVKLTEKPNFDKNRVMACINEYDKRPVFKVFVKNSEPKLYLSGYNFLNKEEKLGRYPVFSAYNPKVFFTKEKTDEICQELNIDGYNLQTE